MNAISMTDLPDGAVDGTSGTREITRQTRKISPALARLRLRWPNIVPYMGIHWANFPGLSSNSIKTDVKITKCKLTKVINKAQKGDLVTKKASLNTINQFYADLKKLHHELIHKVASSQSGDENIDSLVSDTKDYEDEVFANIMALKLDVKEVNGEGSKTTVVENPTESGIQ